MTSSSRQSQELSALLEKWCEGSLSAHEVARLEHLVLADPTAMRQYLDYVHLHGTLHWDAAVPEEPSDGKPIPSRADSTWWSTNDDHSRPSRWRWLMATVSASLLTAIVAAFWFTAPVAPPAQPIADGNRDVVLAPAVAEEQQPLPDRDVPLTEIDLPPTDVSRSESVATNGIEPDSKLLAPSPDDLSELDVVSFIDQVLAENWESCGVTPSPPTDDGEWLRRASLDLTGQIPTLETLDQFERDTNPNKRANFINRVLSGDEFVHYFTTVWANQLVGRSERTAPERHGLQRFLADQFRQNRPWNETVAELIAAEGSVQENGASGFLLAHLNNQAVPATAITARMFLGMQVQCTQCHKHPWNDWTQEQFWNLNAFFQQTRIKRETVSDSVTGTSRTVAMLVNDAVGGPTFFEDRRGVMQATYPVFAEVSVDPGPETNRRRELAGLLSSGDNAQIARAFVNRTWARFFGYGFTNPVDDMGPHNPPTHPELLDRLASEFVASGYDVRQLIRWITSSRAYHLSSRFGEGNAADDPAAGDTPLFSRMPVKTLSPEQVFHSLQVATRGEASPSVFLDYRDEREKWVQQFFEVLENEENGELSMFGQSLMQALTMMNGPLLSNALRDQPGTLLHQVLSDRIDDEERIRRLCRAALARNPSSEELSQFRRMIGQAKSANREDPRAAAANVLRDIYWAYLNSSEFVSNR